jgi:hypothetical protein
LEGNGFVFDAAEDQWDRIVQPALALHKAINGHIDVPEDYVVPSEPPWSEAAWGMKLGETVHGIRSKDAYVNTIPEARGWLEEMEFRFGTTESTRPFDDQNWEQMVWPALQVYAQIYGDMLVGRRYVVPSEPPWPDPAWGMNLGKTVNSIRSRGDYIRNNPERRQCLEGNGFVFDFHKDQWDRIVQPALALYTEINGNVDVKKGWVVPSELPWPEEQRGLNLGTTVDSIRRSGAYVNTIPEAREWLDQQNFKWKMRVGPSEKVRAACKHYGRVQVGEVPVATD